MFRFDQDGIEVETRVPTLAQITTVKQSRHGLFDYDAMRSLVKGTIVSPTFVKLVQQQPSCIQGLGAKIAVAAGVGGMVRLLEEPEIEDEEMAAAFVAQSEKFAKMYSDPEDRRRQLMPVEVFSDLDVKRSFILRPPIEQEVERFRKANTCEAAKLFCTKIAVWGETEELEATLPGMYLTIAEFALDHSGDWQARRLGEA